MQASSVRHFQITISVTFPSNPWQRIRGRCEKCGLSFRRVKANFVRVWGDTDRLEVTVPETPAVKCRCGTRYPDSVISPIRDVMRLVRRCFEQDRPQDWENARDILTPETTGIIKQFQGTLLRPWKQGLTAESTQPSAP